MSISGETLLCGRVCVIAWVAWGVQVVGCRRCRRWGVVLELVARAAGACVRQLGPVKFGGGNCVWVIAKYDGGAIVMGVGSVGDPRARGLVVIIRQSFGPIVWCPNSGRETFTREAYGSAFCADCGATDHEVAS